MRRAQSLPAISPTYASLRNRKIPLLVAIVFAYIVDAGIVSAGIVFNLDRRLEFFRIPGRDETGFHALIQEFLNHFPILL